MGCGILAGMDPHLLRTYVTVARLSSFSEAARDAGLHPVGGVPAHRGPRTGPRRTAAHPPPRRAHRGRRAAPRTRGPAAAAPGRGPRGRRTHGGGPAEHGLTLAAAPTALGPRAVAALPAAGVTVRVLRPRRDPGGRRHRHRRPGPGRRPGRTQRSTAAARRGPADHARRRRGTRVRPAARRPPAGPAHRTAPRRTSPTPAGWTPPTRACRWTGSVRRAAPATASGPPCATRAPTCAS